MTEKQMRQNASVRFYRGKALQKILERYEFTSQQMEIISKAVKSANREKPLFSAIKKADEVILHVTSTQQPKNEPVAIEQIELQMKLFDDMLESKRKESDEIRTKWRNIVYVVIFFGILLLAYFVYRIKSGS